MGFFSKPEVVILKESSNAKEQLQQLEALRTKATGEIAKKIDREISIVKAGIIGEDNILFELRHSGMDMVVLHDLYIESNSGNSAQIDFLVLTPKLNFVIECKNLFGNIEITNKGEFIRTVEYGGKKYKEGIYSPITQNQRHLQVLKECRSENGNGLMRILKNYTFETFFKSLVVLANPKTIVNDRWAKKEIKNEVIRADQLIATIKQMNKESKEFASSLKDLLQAGQRYLAMNREPHTDYLEKFQAMILEVEKAETKEPEIKEAETKEPELKEVATKNEEIKETEAKEAEVKETKAEKSCPRCGQPLVEREAKKGTHVGEKFWGCSAYPKCRYIEKITENKT